MVLIDLENVTNMASPAQLIRDQLRLNRPAAHRWRIVADLQDFRLVPQLRSRVIARLHFDIPNVLRITLHISILDAQETQVSGTTGKQLKIRYLACAPKWRL